MNSRPIPIFIKPEERVELSFTPYHGVVLPLNYTGIKGGDCSSQGLPSLYIRKLTDLLKQSREKINNLFAHWATWATRTLFHVFYHLTNYVSKLANKFKVWIFRNIKSPNIRRFYDCGTTGALSDSQPSTQWCTFIDDVRTSLEALVAPQKTARRW